MANGKVKPGFEVDPRVKEADDPTVNVKSLMAAALDALAELRKADKELHDTKAEHLKEMATLRAEYTKDGRKDDRVTLAAIRQVDITNQNAAAAQIDTAIKALAKSTEDTRKTFADSMESTRKTLADSMAGRDARVDERVTRLESNANLSAGRQSVADPQIAMLLEKMDKVVTVQASGGGKSEGISSAWVVVLGVIAALGTLVGIAAIAVAVIIYLAK